ncbi:MAG: protein kinase [Okeania sp. SIO2G4]|uniref:AAA-like domain-containing protein n=1 Tax=unclassified Okeania TaxID=2634635 RepID=UPI0013B8955B|nr:MULTISPECIES: AAA-like domain-containing protein [unclassified Okeania]NEP40989.1 protein kinase [Okeania sp. SIO2H7]NEP75228.1 protein kinase [Okeania sp. SIO2G5]NEP96309.1 protein kinase [Okeania sp. SIO2F5]NEQ94023.1 protein kinase [Okeania sp. SIO2G4]
MSENNSLIGQTLRQHYKIVEQLGCGGGFGETYIAEDIDIPANPKPQRVVKRLKPTIKHQQVQRLFEQEGQILNRLSRYDKIPTLYAYFEHNQEFYLVQELIIGHDLSTEMSQPWSEAKVLNFLSEILEVLAFVHQDEVIHRDIKPGNIMRRDRDQKLMLIDFGAVKEVSNIVVNSQGKSSSTIAVGTPGYMPVEQAQGRPQFASDIYAVGITAIQALTRVTPRNFIQDELGEIDLQKLAPNISEKLAHFLTKMVRVNWKQRYSDAAVALRALQGNIEPIYGILNWILLKITIGLICQHKNCDFSIFQSCLEFFVGRLQQNSPSVNYELYKTVSISLFKAQEKIAIEYRNQLGGSFPTIVQYSPFHSEQKRENLGWVNRKISKLRSELKTINQTKYVTSFPEDISCLLIPLPPVDEIKNLCQSFILVLLQGDEPDGYLEKLQRDVGGLLNLVAVNFMEEMRHNQLVKEIFEYDFLEIINQQLPGDKLTLEDLDKSLQKVRLELTEFSIQQEKAKTMIISPPINFDVTRPGNSQVEEERRKEEEGRRKKEEGRRKKEEGRRDKEKSNHLTSEQQKKTKEKELSLDTPSGQVALNSPFYVERSPIESECYETIMNPGALIRVKAPRQMGKTSLMSRILNYAEQQGYCKACLNFQSADEEFLTNLDLFLKWFCASITDELNLEEKLYEYWQGVLGSKNKCTNYFQRYLLSEISTPLVLGLDEVDQVFQHPEIATSFFALLRTWHERGKNEAVWQKLRLVIVHSKEVYIPLNINQSPFNVGLPIELRELNWEEVENLVKLHHLEWSSEQIKELMAMVGGHPYLVRQALYQIARGRMTLEKLLQVAPTEESPYCDHLRRHLNNLEENPELLTVIKQIITINYPIPIGTKEGFKLRSMGLVKFQGNLVMPLCELYRKYFSYRL